MKLPAFFSGLSLVLLLSSFGKLGHPAESPTASGTYGVCSLHASAYTFELSLNADQTFHYVNTTVPGKAIDVTGTWEQRGDRILLSNYTSEFPIHDKWKVDKDHGLRSRKGLEFTRLGNMLACR